MAQVRLAGFDRAWKTRCATEGGHHYGLFTMGAIMHTVWLAGSLGEKLVQCLVVGDHKHHLSSFLDNDRSTMFDPGFHFFLDSGAYSAWSKGTVVDIDEYAAFVHAHHEHLDVYVNLDSIPGRPGVQATSSEREEHAGKSWENFLYLSEPWGWHIPGVVPVYHYGEDPKWLLNMLNYGCPYIGLGGMVGTTKAGRQAWLDHVWQTYLTHPDGSAKVQVHGFGMTAVDHIFRYPWHSVDSTSWLRVAAVGGVMVPKQRGGQFVFDQSPIIVSVSDVNPGTAADGRHINSLSPNQRAVVERWLQECGQTLDGCRANYFPRGVANVRFFKGVSAAKREAGIYRPPAIQRGLW